MKNSAIVIIGVIVFVAIISFLSYHFVDNSVSNIRNQVNAGEKEIMELLKNNLDIVEFSENELYSCDDEIIVTYEKSKIELLKNGKVSKIDKELDEQLELLFEKFNCERISLRKERFGKVLEIFLGNVKINKDNVYSHWLTYSKEKSEDLGNEIFPNWYYKTLFYT